jgi:hypothetical protein
VVQTSVVDLIETRLAVDYTDVVDQSSDGAQLGGRFLEEAADVGFVANVGLDGYGGAAVFSDRCYDIFGERFLAEEIYAHSVAANGGKLDGGSSNASAGAGND